MTSVLSQSAQRNPSRSYTCRRSLLFTFAVMPMSGTVLSTAFPAAPSMQHTRARPPVRTLVVLRRVVQWRVPRKTAKGVSNERNEAARLHLHCSTGVLSLSRILFGCTGISQAIWRNTLWSLPAGNTTCCFGRGGRAQRGRRGKTRNVLKLILLLKAANPSQSPAVTALPKGEPRACTLLHSSMLL